LCKKIIHLRLFNEKGLHLNLISELLSTIIEYDCKIYIQTATDIVDLTSPIKCLGLRIKNEPFIIKIKAFSNEIIEIVEKKIITVIQPLAVFL